MFKAICRGYNSIIGRGPKPELPFSNHYFQRPFDCWWLENCSKHVPEMSMSTATFFRARNYFKTSKSDFCEGNQYKCPHGMLSKNFAKEMADFTSSSTNTTHETMRICSYLLTRILDPPHRDKHYQNWLRLVKGLLISKVVHCYGAPTNSFIHG